MVRKIKSLEELIVDLNQIKSSYEHQGYNLNEKKGQYKECTGAKQFIRSNKDLDSAHPTILGKKTDNTPK